MKILLVRPKPHKETIGLKHVMICEPLELEYLVSNIPEELKGICQGEIVDMILEKKTFREILQEKEPDMVLYTGYITHVGTIREMAGLTKSHLPDAITGVGGVHGEVVPEDFLDPNIDLVFGRNGVEAFQSTLRGLLSGETLEKIKRDNFEISRKELDFTLNTPDRSSVSRYRKDYYYMFHNPCALIKTSYGCPYNCSFCFCKEITNGNYHSRSMESVIEEIKQIPEEEIYIVDDDFLFGREKLLKFAELLKKEGIDKKFLVYGRADFIVENRDIMELLKDVGLRAVIVGIESIRESDFVDYNKKTSREINERCIETLNKLGIELYATMIVPLDFSRDDFRQLTRWLRKQKVTFVNLQPLTPLPGTEIFDKYRDKLLYDRTEHHVFDMAHVVLKPEKMSVRMFYLRLLLSYYSVVTRPVNIIRLIKEYGVAANIRMLKGSQMVSLQYWKKIARGY
ncbi:B12-binding domain-containing radical SAM protein [Gudongella sp. DL1XJH-153]|uniref:B12-binding domain-containing radical SAM protein n=1 Tax=Gudongella sp. DL1XJH-153 TaxID=3409804 RepID=UPI003BB70DAB